MDAASLYQKGYGTNKIAEMLGCHRATVQRKLLKDGVALRKRSPQIHYDIEAFKHLSQESCYWAGFIAADGNVRSDRDTIQVHLAIKDINHLLKLKKFVCLDGDVEVFKTSCRLSINGNWFVKDLNDNFNITPKKSLTYCPPTLPSHLMKHFIRGYFDGDGSITKTTVPTISLVGTEKICIAFNDFAKSLGVKLKSKNTTAPLIKTSAAFQVSYSGRNAYKLLDDMYSDATIYLDRKKEAFDRHFAKYKEVKNG